MQNLRRNCWLKVVSGALRLGRGQSGRSDAGTPRVLLTLLLVAATSFSTACTRPNPRIKSFGQRNGGFEKHTTFEYDDAGHPSTVTTESGASTTTRTLTWTDNALAKVKTVANSDDASETSNQEFTYEGGRVVKAIRDSGAESTGTIDFTYDGAGRLAASASKFTFESGTSTGTTTWDYDDTGGLTKLAFSVAFDDGETVDESEATYSLSWGDGLLLSFDVIADSIAIDGISVDARYDGGRLDGMTITAPVDDENGLAIEVADEVSYDYDDAGRVIGGTSEFSSGGDENFTAEYEDAEANGIDMTPGALWPLGLPLWDLTGQSHKSIDPHTVLPRFAGASW